METPTHDQLHAADKLTRDIAFKETSEGGMFEGQGDKIHEIYWMVGMMGFGSRAHTVNEMIAMFPEQDIFQVEP